MDQQQPTMTLNLQEDDTVKEVERYVENLRDFDDSTNAFWFQKNFTTYLQKESSAIAKTHPEFVIAYEQALVQCRWVAFPLLVDHDAIQLVEQYTMDVYDLPEFRFGEKIRQKLITIIDLDARDTFKKQLREAFLRNVQVFIDSPVEYEKEARKGTVSEWLRDYLRNVGTKGTTTVQLIQYLTSGLNTRKLSEQDRNRLKQLMMLYERLSRSSKTRFGLEEPIPVDDPKSPGTIRNGVFEPINPEVVKKIDAFRSIRDAALGIKTQVVQSPTQLLSLTMKDLPKTGIVIGEIFFNDPQAFIRALNEAVAGKDIMRVGALLLAARQNEALKSLERVQAVKKLVYYDLKTKQFQWK